MAGFEAMVGEIMQELIFNFHRICQICRICHNFSGESTAASANVRFLTSNEKTALPLTGYRLARQHTSS